MDIPVTLRRIRHERAERDQQCEIATRDLELADAALYHKGVDGKNEAERKARLVLLRADDPDYQGALSRLDWLKAEIERLRVEEAYYSDLRRADEWEIRRRQAAALYRPADTASDPVIDEAIDDEVPF